MQPATHHTPRLGITTIGRPPPVIDSPPRSDAMTALARLGRAAIVTGDVRALADEVLVATGDLCGGDGSGMLLLDDTGRLELVAGVGWIQAAVGTVALLPRADSLAGFPATTGRAVLVADSSQEVRHRLPGFMTDRGTASALAVAIDGANGPIGVLVTTSDEAHRFDQSTVETAQGLANVMATALERQRVADALQQARLYDETTGLANDVLLRERVRAAVARMEHPRDLAVMTIGLSGPAGIEWDYGVAERVLAAAASRVAHELPDLTVARLTGTELGLLFERSSGARDADSVAAVLLELFDEAIEIDGHHHEVVARIGIASPDDAETTPEELIARAHQALERAHLRLDGVVVEHFDPKVRAALTSRLRLIDDLRRAIDEGSLDVAFQPALSFRTGKVVSAEALLRWKRDPMPPIPEVIAVAEETGLIVPLTDMVLRRACATHRWWRSRWGDDTPCVAVNLSPVQLRDPGLIESVHSALASSEMPPGALIFEITEGAMIDDPVTATRTLERLREAGARLAIDDFGTGYSSLSYLRRLPVDTLKIDRGFVATIESEPEDRAVVAALSGLSRALRLTVVAEGVETEAQAEVLRSLGCDIGQGFLWSPAVPAEDFVTWVEANGGPAGCVGAP